VLEGSVLCWAVRRVVSHIVSFRVMLSCEELEALRWEERDGRKERI
jgi:hypothetical protein